MPWRTSLSIQIKLCWSQVVEVTDLILHVSTQTVFFSQPFLPRILHDKISSCSLAFITLLNCIPDAEKPLLFIGETLTLGTNDLLDDKQQHHWTSFCALQKWPLGSRFSNDLWKESCSDVVWRGGSERLVRWAVCFLTLLMSMWNSHNAIIWSACQRTVYSWLLSKEFSLKISFKL